MCWLELGTGSTLAKKGTGTGSPWKNPSERVAGPNGLKLSDRGWPHKTRLQRKARGPASVRWSAWLDTAPTERRGEQAQSARKRLKSARKGLLKEVGEARRPTGKACRPARKARRLRGKRRRPARKLCRPAEKLCRPGEKGRRPAGKTPRPSGKTGKPAWHERLRCLTPPSSATEAGED